MTTQDCTLATTTIFYPQLLKKWPCIDAPSSNEWKSLLALAQSSPVMSMAFGTYPDSLVAWAKLIKRRQVTVRVCGGWCVKKITLDEREINRQIYDEAKTQVWDISEKNFFLAGFGKDQEREKNWIFSLSLLFKTFFQFYFVNLRFPRNVRLQSSTMKLFC